ncbi:MAG: diguanylate cyclase [Dehalococcoidia bacterium]
MVTQPALLASDDTPEEMSTRRKLVTYASFLLWVGIIAFQVLHSVASPTALNVVSVVVLLMLFVAVNAQIILIRAAGTRNWSRLIARLHGNAYLSDFHSMPNRNYLLSELRREMPRSRQVGKPFTLLVVTFESIDDIRKRRGTEFCDRAIRALADVLQRVTRKSDFVAHLGEARFCTLLNECAYEQSFIYLARLPGNIGVSDGKQMYDVPISVRVMQYDMESIYATDVLREAEDMAPLRHQDHKEHHWSQVA